MGASIECRVPFLDYRLVEGLASLPSGIIGDGNKRLLRQAIGNRLPVEVLRGRKWGFAVPWSTYLRSVPELKEFVRELPDVEPIRSGPLEPRSIRRAVDAFMAGSDRNAALIQELVMISVWHQCCILGRRGAHTLVP